MSAREPNGNSLGSDFPVLEHICMLKDSQKTSTPQNNGVRFPLKLSRMPPP
jgi:hypothetical protein